MTLTEPQAREAVLAHHQALEAGVKSRVEAFVRSLSEGGAHERAAAEVVAYLVGEVLPHAQAEEQTLYQAVRAHHDLTGTLDDMIGEHHTLASMLGRLADAPGGQDAVATAEQIASLFSAHVAKENEIVLPAVVANDRVDLAQLLSEMHHLTETAQQPADLPEQPAADLTVAVLSLLLEATSDLARRGEADRACQLVASAWATLRAARPELAVRLTAALHGLSRLTAAEPVALRSAQEVGGGGELADPPLDVRPLAPAQRHQLIFSTYDELVPGAGFVLVNDHDPKPLRYQFEAEHAGEFTWDSIEAGPTVWQVRIGRSPTH